MLLTCPSSGRPLGNWVTKVEDASLLGPVPVLLIFIVLFSFRQKSMDSTAFEATQGGLQLQQEGSNAVTIMICSRDLSVCRTIGTALFVQIGQPLIQGGPGSLFIAFTLW